MKEYVNVLVDMDNGMVHLPGEVHAVAICGHGMTQFMSVPIGALPPTALNSLCPTCFRSTPTGSYV